MRVHISQSPGSRSELIWQVPDGAAEWNVHLNRLYLILVRDPNSGADPILQR